MHNNATHISNVVKHKLMIDMHTLLSLPFHMMFETYDFHVAWQDFCISWIRILFFGYNCMRRSLTQLKLFLFIKRASDMHSTTYNLLIHMKTYGADNIWIVLIWFLTWNINSCKFCTTMQHTFPTWSSINLWLICTHCCHFHVIWCLKHMISMWRDRIFLFPE